jgi:hypothetical protein
VQAMKSNEVVRPLVSYSTCFALSGDRLLSTFAVAKRLNKTPRTVRNYIHGGKLSAIRKRKLWFCKESDVVEFILRISGGAQ